MSRHTETPESPDEKNPESTTQAQQFSFSVEVVLLKQDAQACAKSLMETIDSARSEHVDIRQTEAFKTMRQSLLAYVENVSRQNHGVETLKISISIDVNLKNNAITIALKNNASKPLARNLAVKTLDFYFPTLKDGDRLCFDNSDLVNAIQQYNTTVAVWRSSLESNPSAKEGTANRIRDMMIDIINQKRAQLRPTPGDKTREVRYPGSEYAYSTFHSNNPRNIKTSNTVQAIIRNVLDIASSESEKKIYLAAIDFVCADIAKQNEPLVKDQIAATLVRQAEDRRMSGTEHQKMGGRPEKLVPPDLIAIRQFIIDHVQSYIDMRKQQLTESDPNESRFAMGVFSGNRELTKKKIENALMLVNEVKKADDISACDNFLTHSIDFDKDIDKRLVTTSEYTKCLLACQEELELYLPRADATSAPAAKL